MKTLSLTTGKVLDIHTKSSDLTNGAFELTSNSVESGQIMRIRGDKITSANMIDILSSSGNLNASSQIININAIGAKNGVIVDVKSPSLLHGYVISLTSAKLTSGKIINMIDNTKLTRGKLLHVKSKSPNASNPLHLEFPKIDTGDGVRLDIGKHLTSGVGILLDTDDGNQMATGGALMFVNGMKQRQGTLLHINVLDLSDGSAVTLDTLSSMSTGTLLNAITTTSIGHVDGAVRLVANEMKTGTGMKINSNGLTYGKALHVTSNDGNMLESDGRLIYIDGDDESDLRDDASMVEVNGQNMADGTLLKLTQMKTLSLTTGKVLDIHTKSSDLTNGAFELTSNSVESGQIMRIRGDKITSANMIDILSSSGNLNASSQIININAIGAKNGVIVDVKSPSLLHGYVISLTSAKLTSGKIINMIDNTKLTRGKLLHVKSKSPHASNPLQFDF